MCVNRKEFSYMALILYTIYLFICCINNEISVLHIFSEMVTPQV